MGPTASTSGSGPRTTRNTMAQTPANTGLYAGIVKSTVPPWSLRQMETLEARVEFVKQVHSAAAAIIDQAGAIDVQFFGNLLLTLTDTTTLSYLCSLEHTSAQGAKRSLLDAGGVKELIAAVAERSILKINALEELETYLLLVDVPPDSIYEWYQSRFRELTQYPEIITSLDLDNMVSYLKDNGNLLQFIPTSTLQSYIMLSGCLELMEGFDKFTLNISDKDPYSVWLSKIAGIASYQEQRFFVDGDKNDAMLVTPRKKSKHSHESNPGAGPDETVSVHRHDEGIILDPHKPFQETRTQGINNGSIFSGDLVFVEASVFSGSAGTLAPLFTLLTTSQSLLGPYKVLEELPGNQYELEIPEELGGMVKFEKGHLVKVMTHRAPASALEQESRDRVRSETPNLEGSQVLNVRKRSNAYRVNMKTHNGRIFFESLDRVINTKEWKKYVSTHPIIPEKISKMEEIDGDDDMEE